MAHTADRATDLVSVESDDDVDALNTQRAQSLNLVLDEWLPTDFQQTLRPVLGSLTEPKSSARG